MGTARSRPGRLHLPLLAPGYCGNNSQGRYTPARQDLLWRRWSRWALQVPCSSVPHVGSDQVLIDWTSQPSSPLRLVLLLCWQLHTQQSCGAPRRFISAFFL